MISLYEITELVANNENCVVLKVLPNHTMDLMSMGCFRGSETMFRLTKGNTVTCTMFSDNGKSCSWQWGSGGTTLVSDSLATAGHMIQRCIEKDYGIKCLK